MTDELAQVLIQAVPWDRRRWAAAKQLAADTGGSIVWDRARSGYLTWLDVLRAAGDAPMWVIEDDVVLCPNWTSEALAVQREHPDHVIRAFTIAPDVRSGMFAGIGYYSNSCSYLPEGAARAVLDFCVGMGPRLRAECGKLHDHTVGLWLDSVGRDYWVHTPSLVQHREWPSLIDPAGRRMPRLSPTFFERYGR